MDAILPPVDEKDADAALRQTVLSLRLALETFEDVILRVGTLDVDVTDTQVSKAILRLREGFQALIRERQKLEADTYGRSGGAGAEPIDQAAARAEIGRLLDRLRAAGDSGDVPEQPEP